MQSNVSPQVRVASQRRVVVLGSTGSIGVQTLDVARRHPDRLKIVGLAAGTRGAELLAQAKGFNVGHLALGKPEAVSASVVAELEEQAAGFVGTKGSIGFGSDAVREMVHLDDQLLRFSDLILVVGDRVRVVGEFQRTFFLFGERRELFEKGLRTDEAEFRLRTD